MTLRIDATSLLVHVDGAVPLAEVEAALSVEGLTLDVEGLAARGTTRVSAWLAAGAPGTRDPFRDPVDHVVAGLEATLPDGRVVEVRPAPRRSVGPDLIALFVGTREQFGRIKGAWLRVHRRGAVRPSAPPFTLEGPAAPTEDERRLLDALARELGAAPMP